MPDEESDEESNEQSCETSEDFNDCEYACSLIFLNWSFCEWACDDQPLHSAYRKSVKSASTTSSYYWTYNY